MIKDGNPFELDEAKKLRYTVSTIKLFERDATKETVDLAIKKAEEREVDKPTYRDVDTRVKALQHLTDNDLKEVQLSASDMKELIAEARSKIQPVIHAMSKEELNSLLMSLEEAKKNNQIIITPKYFNEVLDQIGITAEELRKIQDKHYEIDVQYELTRDLYEKQRVVDKYLEAHQEDNQLLNQYFSNSYFKAAPNKFETLIYTLPYDPLTLRQNYRMMLISTGVTGFFFFMVNPMLPLVLTYDVFLLMNAFRVLNQVTEYINLCSSKRHIFLNKLNFLGYLREPKRERISLQDIKYIGEYRNKSLTLTNYGLLPSLARLLNYKSETEPGDFSKFYKFLANNQVYLVSKDHPYHSQYCINEALLDDIINGRQKRVFEYNFTEEDR